MTEREQEELARLRKRVEVLERMNEALMDRVERTVDDTGNAYAIFERNLLMQHTIRERTNELAEANEALTQEIEVRRAAEDEMRHAKEAAEQANSAKSQFLANMSHEIRTPLSAIIGFAGLIVEEPANERRVAESAATIQRNGDHLVALINDILDLSKLESGEFSLQNGPVDVREICEDVYRLFTVPAKEKALVIEFRDCSRSRDPVLSDAMRIRQILLNLVSNAVKFTERGRVGISCLTEFAGDSIAVCVEIEDTGIGMSPEDLTRIFNPFVQVDSSMTRSQAGTGLGLSIARRFAELLDGSLSVESEPGVGTRFRLEFAAPIARIQPEAATTSPAAGGNTADVSNLQVLLVDDGPDNRKLLGFHLKKLGARVTIACDGVEAIEKVHARSEPFDAIFMDMQMPRLDGYEATHQLREEGYKGYIIALTAHAMSGDRQKCLDAGCDDYETKPVTRHALAETLARALASNQERWAA